MLYFILASGFVCCCHGIGLPPVVYVANFRNTINKTTHLSGIVILKVTIYLCAGAKLFAEYGLVPSFWNNPHSILEVHAA